jgi:cytochrome-b5 reductase
MIKKYDDGKLTPYIHTLKVGDKLAFKGPIKKWAYKGECSDRKTGRPA